MSHVTAERTHCRPLLLTLEPSLQHIDKLHDLSSRKSTKLLKTTILKFLFNCSLQRIMSLLERSLAISHDLGMMSIAFPLIGAGVNNYPCMDVVKSILDACSLFRHKCSPLKRVVIVVWKNDTKNKPVGHLYMLQVTYTSI